MERSMEQIIRDAIRREVLDEIRQRESRESDEHYQWLRMRNENTWNFDREAERLLRRQYDD